MGWHINFGHSWLLLQESVGKLVLLSGCHLFWIIDVFILILIIYSSNIPHFQCRCIIWISFWNKRMHCLHSPQRDLNKEEHKYHWGAPYSWWLSGHPWNFLATIWKWFAIFLFSGWLLSLPSLAQSGALVGPIQILNDLQSCLVLWDQTNQLDPHAQSQRTL